MKAVLRVEKINVYLQAMVNNKCSVNLEISCQCLLHTSLSANALIPN